MAFLRSLYNTSKSLSVSTFISRLVFGRASLERPQKPCLQSLPNELLLEIFSFLELKPYIICHGVCKDWRDLLPSTKLHPIRERLLDLYYRILNTPDFQKAFEWAAQNLQPLDREEYIRCLLTQYPAIPEEFRMWILEWPAQLAIQSTWPGLPFIYCRTISQIDRRSGLSWIAHRSFSPQLSSLVYKYKTPSQTFIPALYIWRYAGQTDWLIFEQNEPDLFGRVFIVDHHAHSVGAIPGYPPRQDSDSDDSENSEYYPMVEDDWICYLEYLWNQTAYALLHTSQIFRRYPDFQIAQPLEYQFSTGADQTLPAPAWDSCQRTMDRRLKASDIGVA